MRYKDKYREIVDELIERSFPELESKEIKIVEFPNVFIGESFSTKGIYNKYIFINKKCRDRSVKVLKGQLAHELCHIVLDYSDKSCIGSFFHFYHKNLSVGLNTKFSRLIEEKIDRETIKRGYAKERYALVLDWNKKYGEKKLDKIFYPRGYLRSNEIKSYAKKIGKW